jgi:hypothetical protein
MKLFNNTKLEKYQIWGKKSFRSPGQILDHLEALEEIEREMEAIFDEANGIVEDVNYS